MNRPLSAIPTRLLLDELIYRIPSTENENFPVDSKNMISYLIIGRYIKWLCSNVCSDSSQTLDKGTNT